jgi:Cu+-exporting ATPase
VSSLPGVKTVDVNLANERATLEYDPSLIRLDSIEKAIEETGYRVVYEKLTLVLEGISDSSDAKMMENFLGATEGVRRVSVNFGNSQVSIEYNPTLITSADLRRVIADNGYAVVGESSTASAQNVEAAKLRKSFLVGIVFTIPAVLLSYPEIFGFLPFAGTNLAAYAAFASASVVQFITGSRFYVGAFRMAKLRSANMDTLVVLGTTAAFVFSAFNTFPVVSWHGIYYDASTLVIAFIILGKYLEIKTKGRTSSIIKKMLELQPKTALVKRADGSEVETSVELVKPGDIMLVKPGSQIPVDSEVIQGESAVDESMVTGESVPVRKVVGDSVLGGSVSTEGVLLIKATKVGNDSFLSQVARLVEDALGNKPPIQRLVDRVAGYFAYIVISVAAVAFLAWSAFIPGDLASATIPAVAILVVACPCALGLATPTAMIVGMGKAASIGVLFKSGEAIEALSKISVAVFDKTGTLTEGRPSVTDIVVITKVLTTKESGKTTNPELQALELAATAEQYSEHPLAKAVMSAAKSKGIPALEVDDFRMSPGMGVMVVSNGGKIRVGNVEFTKSAGLEITTEISESLQRLQKEGKTVVVVSFDSTIVALIGLVDVPKEGAREAIEELKRMGVQTVMLTGDNVQTAKIVAGNLGLDRVHAGVLPSGKVDVIKQLQQNGRKVAMIGDGFNDAPALSIADVGIAMGAGTDLAIEAGSVVLVRNDIKDIVTAVHIARKIVSKIKQNLAYAFMYNVILVPVAGLGLLYPALAGLAMAASSVSVTASSLALKRWNPKK